MNEIIGFAVVIVTIFAGILFNNSRSSWSILGLPQSMPAWIVCMPI